MLNTQRRPEGQLVHGPVLQRSSVGVRSTPPWRSRLGKSRETARRCRRHVGQRAGPATVREGGLVNPSPTICHTGAKQPARGGRAEGDGGLSSERVQLLFRLMDGSSESYWM